MSHGILINAVPTIPAHGSISSGTEIFRCHEYNFNRDIIMYTASAATGVYVVSYDVTPDVAGGIDRRWLYYSSADYLIAFGNNTEAGSYYSENAERHTNYYFGTIGAIIGYVDSLIYSDAIYNYPDLASALEGEGIWENITYPITYSSTNSTVSGPTEAAIGDTVTVSAVPDVNYVITDQSSQIAVTCNDEPVAFTWDATNQRITFTMPDPT